MKRMGLIVMMMVFASSIGRAQEVMPLSEVKPGMECHGLSDFGKGIQKFNCKVVDIITGISYVGHSFVLVEIVSTQDNDLNEILNQANFLAGLSGSPLYSNEGKLFGSAAVMFPFSKKTQILATPIEFTLNFKTKASELPNKLLDNSKYINNLATSTNNNQPEVELKPGEFYAVCPVWGDADTCEMGTVINFDPETKLAYLAGHDSGGLPKGVSGAPLFKAKAIAVQPNFNKSSKLGVKTGPIIGAVIFNGPFGLTAKLGVTPKYFPVEFELHNVYRDGIGKNVFNFAYTPGISFEISDLFQKKSSLIDASLESDLEYTVLAEGFMPVFSRGKFDSSSTLSKVVGMFSKKEELDPVIKSVFIKLVARSKYKKFDLKEVVSEKVEPIVSDKSANSENKFLISLTIQGGGDKLKHSFSYNIAKEYEEKTLYVANGEGVAGYILQSNLPRQKVSELLNQVTDKNALYLYYRDKKDTSSGSGGMGGMIQLIFGSAGGPGTDPVLNLNLPSDFPKTDTPANSPVAGSSQGWVSVGSVSDDIKILKKIELPDKDYFVSGEQSFVVKFVTEQMGTVKVEPQKKKKKFWLF
ncbi:MAG: hypothetical protein Q8Q06_03985 [bacterium]|nr:hypothetical protein [bacterium]